MTTNPQNAASAPANAQPSAPAPANTQPSAPASANALPSAPAPTPASIQPSASTPANAQHPAPAPLTGADAGSYPDSVTVGVRDDLHLHVLTWGGTRRPFVLLHGLASNAHTWRAVARELQAAGHPVYAVDQRGHGRSDKPDDGYDFATVAEDLARLCDVLQLDRPIVAGQSWGGNVVLDFGARYGDRAAGLVLVDGGFLDLQSRPDVTWERIADQLRPPPLAGTPRQELKDRMAHWHSDWTEEGIEGTLHNFETLPDGTIRPWLTLDRHMRILRALWDQRPPQIYPQVRVPVLLAAAEDNDNPEWMAVKHRQVAAAAALLPDAEVHWFPATAHDIHVHRPATLAQLMLDWSQQR